MMNAEYKIAELKQKFGSKQVESYIKTLNQDHSYETEQNYKQGIAAAENSINEAKSNLYKLDHTYDPRAAGAVRLSQNISTSAMGQTI